MGERSRPRSGVFTILLLCGLSLAMIHLYMMSFTSLHKEQVSGVVEIPFGASIQKTARILFDEGWIPSASAFTVLVRLTRSQGPVRAGEYRVSSELSPWEILNLLRKGSVVLHRLTIPEGLRGAEIAQIAADKLSLGRQRFLDLLSDPDFIHSLGLSVSSLEGYLMPETYSFAKSVTEEQVIRKMVQEMVSFLDQAKRDRAESLGMGLDEILTLASIVEKEKGVEQEGPLISSVYHNRLKKKMRLQSDPTVIYGIKDFDGDLRWSDLKQDTPYNTYVRPGLPPTPIANPGKASILASLYPEDTSYLYFVSRNDRTHVFSETLAEHNRAVNQYQKRSK